MTPKDYKLEISENQRKAVKSVMALHGLNVSTWANKAGITEGALRSFLNGTNKAMGSDNLKLLADCIGISLSQLLGENLIRRIPVVGYVGAGAEIYPIDDHAKGASMEDVDAPPFAPKIDTRNMVAVKVRGDSMHPVMKDGWVIYYNERHEGGCDDLINSLAVVKIVDGPTLVKEIKRSSTKGRYTLFSYNSTDMENVEIEWCAAIVFIKPKQ